MSRNLVRVQLPLVDIASAMLSGGSILSPQIPLDSKYIRAYVHNEHINFIFENEKFESVKPGFPIPIVNHPLIPSLEEE